MATIYWVPTITVAGKHYTIVVMIMNSGVRLGVNSLHPFTTYVTVDISL